MTIDELKSQITTARQNGLEEFTTRIDKEDFSGEMRNYIKDELFYEPMTKVFYTDLPAYGFLEVRFLDSKPEPEIVFRPDPLLRSLYSSMVTLNVHHNNFLHADGAGYLRFAVRCELERLGFSFWPGMRALERDYLKQNKNK